ncbi:MAG: type IV secretion system DNA-binding domain-containing protein [Candidatus Pacebacteria bacterium]|jgi:hypothetical protein|nr:type IV secretion system DNA-binding domain-containing protein [Candidatus Paceibacterota bacterium]
METERFQELPKFQSPEEELVFLREQIAKREKELSEARIETTKERIAEETLKVYAEIDAAEVLHPKHEIPKEEAEGIVLKLRPEAHDAKIEQLFSLLLEKGIKNTLTILAGLKNPHLDDDFHRFLVQYLQSTGAIPGLKEGTPMYKALKMRLFELTFPEQDETEKRGFKEFISAMEQFYAGMQSVGEGRDNYGKNYFTLEIALSNVGSEVVFYAAVPVSKADLFEKQVLAFYHGAKIREISDDYNIFTEGGASAGAYAALGAHDALPIKTHDKIDHDPLNTIVSAFSKIQKEGEGAAIQICIMPGTDAFIQRFNKTLADLKEGKKIEKESKIFSEFDKAFGRAVKELILGTRPKEEQEEKKIDDRSIGFLNEKMKSTVMAAAIRIVASASTVYRAEEIVNDLTSAFNQFDETNANRIIFEKLEERQTQAFLHDYSYRIFPDDQAMPLNLKELATLFHFPVAVESSPQLKQAKAGIAPAPLEMGTEGILLGVNDYRGVTTKIHMGREDRVRHMYVIGQTGTGKTTILKNMIAQDIANGDGCCFIDPHGTDIQDILSYVPEHRIDDVIYFDPAYTARPMGLNMLEYDERFPEQKTFVVNELMGIFNKLFDMKTSGGPMFEQYFKNSAFLVMEHPESGATLLEIGRVLSDKAFRDMKLSHCKNPIITQFWANAEKTTGDQSIANFVPYITSKFDNFISNDIMRPVVLQEKSVFNFRKIMDEKKILLVNLSKGRLGDINANLIGLLLVGKIQMAALSRVDMYGQKMNDFYLYMDEFQNITTDSIASILSEARKYRLSLNVAHQYISQLEENIKNAVFGNVGSMAVYRVSPEDAKFLESKFTPTFGATDITKLDNFNSYVNMLVSGTPVKPFSMTSHWSLLPKGNPDIVEPLKELSYLRYGRDREEVEAEIMAKYRKGS